MNNLIPDYPVEEFKTIKNRCCSDFSSKELWPTYYERRYLEFLTFYDLLPDKKYVKILELGCGIGYYSAFLSKISAHVTATDLEQTDPATHSPGLQATHDFLSSLGIENVTVMHASADDLPFEDASFDLVFSSHVLEHVPQMQKAISEINRVLKPGGYNFCIVPTTTDRIYTFFTFPLYLLERLAAKIFHKLSPKKEKAGSAAEVNRSQSTSSVRFYLRHFPFPPPHGTYPDYFTELRKWTIGNWKKLITKDQSIKLHAQYGLQMNPFLPLLGSFFPKAGIKLYAITRRAENKLSGTFIFRYFGISTLVITQKSTERK